MAYEQKYTLAEAKTELARLKAGTGNYTVLIRVIEPMAGSGQNNNIEHVAVTCRAGSLEAAIMKAQKHLGAELEELNATVERDAVIQVSTDRDAYRYPGD